MNGWLLALAIFWFIVQTACFMFVGFAYSMSDDPTQKMPLWPWMIAYTLNVLCFIAAFVL